MALAVGLVLWVKPAPHPDEWDERVADLARFVEVERGRSFDHPVSVEFLSEED